MIVAIRRELLEILACPRDKSPVRLTADGAGLVCDVCRMVYPIRDDIPIMLIEEARPFTEAS